MLVWISASELPRPPLQYCGACHISQEHTLNMHVAFNSLHLCLFLSLLVPVFANTEIINIHAALNHDVLLPETAEL